MNFHLFAFSLSAGTLLGDLRQTNTINFANYKWFALIPLQWGEGDLLLQFNIRKFLNNNFNVGQIYLPYYLSRTPKPKIKRRVPRALLSQMATTLESVTNKIRWRRKLKQGCHIVCKASVFVGFSAGFRRVGRLIFCSRPNVRAAKKRTIIP